MGMIYWLQAPPVARNRNIPPSGTFLVLVLKGMGVEQEERGAKKWSVHRLSRRREAE